MGRGVTDASEPGRCARRELREACGVRGRAATRMTTLSHGAVWPMKGGPLVYVTREKE